MMVGIEVIFEMLPSHPPKCDFHTVHDFSTISSKFWARREMFLLGWCGQDAQQNVVGLGSFFNADDHVGAGDDTCGGSH